MRKAKVTSSGRISIPADIRRRWGTADISIEDHGDRLIVRPLPQPEAGFVRRPHDESEEDMSRRGSS